MSTRKTTCGISNSWFIYIIGVASLLESIAFMIGFAQIIADVQEQKYQQLNSVTKFNVRVEVISGFGVIVNGLRFMIALALLIGRYYMRKMCILIFFVICTILGVPANIEIGILAMSSTITHVIGVAHISVLAIHIQYIIIVTKIYMQEKAIAMLTPPLVVGPIGHLPNSVPLPAIISIETVESHNVLQSIELQSEPSTSVNKELNTNKERLERSDETRKALNRINMQSLVLGYGTTKTTNIIE